ncbi:MULTISPECIES: hypothetical protein [unclassified Streptomyces]|uniref:hypothetical protein n=1 Tax=unclassified Streptomyces TaxID=2593676 RepID=UPI0035DF1320
MHIAVYSTALAMRGGGSVGYAAACETAHIMLDETMSTPAEGVAQGGRCRRRACQALFHAAGRHRSDLGHIRSYYGLERRIGITVGLGLRVRHEGRPGAIIDTAGQYLVVRLDDEVLPVKVHATSGMEYEGLKGWVRAVPLPDPYAVV